MHVRVRNRYPTLPKSAALALLASLFAPACSALGPSNIPPDQFDYNQAIGQASNEQMLLNLIRLRYRDVPVFLAVNSVLTQYIYAGNVGLTGTAGTLQGESTNSVGAVAGVRYVERPTITYTPLQGEEFAKQLMTPIPGHLLFSLMQSGWPADDMMAMGMERLGRARNPFTQMLLTEEGRQRQREFRKTTDLVIQVGVRDGMEMLRGVEDGGSTEDFIVFDRSADEETAALVEELKRRLGLPPEVWKFRVTHNVIERREGDITMRVRSLLDMMGYLSGGVQVPARHQGPQVASVTKEERMASEMVPLRIRSGAELPDEVFVSVNYLDQWFWIDSYDEQSKASFGLLTYLFLMMAPKPEGAGPLLTVPVG